MSTGSTPVVYFDLAQTLGWESQRPTDDARTELHLYEDVRQRLRELRDDGVRLGLLVAGDRWDAARLRRVRDETGLGDLVDAALVQHCARDSVSQFRVAAERADGPCFFVSTSARRRQLARSAGMTPIPHPALALEVVRGARIVLERIVAPQGAAARIASLCRTHPFAVPVSIAVRKSDVVVDVLTTRHATAALAAAPGAMHRFAQAGFAVTRLSDDDALSCDSLIRVAPAPTGAPVATPTLRAIAPAAAGAEETAGIALSADAPPRGNVPVGCCDASPLLEPRLALLAEPRDPSSADDFSLDDDARDAICKLDATEYRRWLAPWWKDTAVAPSPRIASRHAAHPDNAIAVAEAARYLRETCGAENVRLLHFLTDVAPNLCNVEATIPADPDSGVADEIVLLGAHLDSINAAGGVDADAPGLDDDASGMAGVLAVASILSGLPRPRRRIRFVLFNAEEQGLIGSLSYAGDHESVDHVVAMLQLDMIGLVTDATKPTQFEVHTGNGSRFGSPEQREKLKQRAARLGDVVAEAARLVAPQLQLQRYPLAGDCDDQASHSSDHAPFYGQQIPACVICENFYLDDCPGGRRKDHPTYHSASDTEVDPELAAAITRAAAAAVWMRANAR